MEGTVKTTSNELQMRINHPCKITTQSRVKAKYCSECGKKIVFVKGGKYDSYTGKKVKIPRCINKECFIGNYFNCSHKYGFFSGKCKKCEMYNNIDYDIEVAEWVILNR